MNLDRYYSKIRLQKGRLVILAALLVVLTTSLVGLVWYENKTGEVSEVIQETDEIEVTGPVLTESEPVSISIPAINLETDFVPSLGLKDSGEIEVPDSYEKVGWYKYGPTPGELGPAVVLGHVDSFEGPAVFWSLGQLEEGDDIYIVRNDGTAANFEVTKLERPSQSNFPTQSVYGDIDHAGLRLITCSGTYKRNEDRYTHNLIVYAKLKE